MSTRPLAQPIDVGWWSALTDADKVALLQAFKFRTGVDLTAVERTDRRGSPSAMWQDYEAREAGWRARRAGSKGRCP